MAPRLLSNLFVLLVTTAVSVLLPSTAAFGVSSIGNPRGYSASFVGASSRPRDTVKLSAASKATATATKPASSSSTANKKKDLPKFDTKLNKWVYTADWQKPTEGYDKVGSLLRHGIPPYYNRVFKEDEYEQAVLKFMAGDKCYDRNVAQGNMDFFLRNANDWMYNRYEDQKRGTKRDYVQQVILTITWSIIVTAYLSFGTYTLVNRYFGPL
jgi:hypothetical protein